jgi:hypothetical protein
MLDGFDGEYLGIGRRLGTPSVAVHDRTVCRTPLVVESAL